MSHSVVSRPKLILRQKVMQRISMQILALQKARGALFEKGIKLLTGSYFWPIGHDKWRKRRLSRACGPGRQKKAPRGAFFFFRALQAFDYSGGLSFRGACHAHPGGFPDARLWLRFFHDPILTACWRRQRAGSPAPGFAVAGWWVWTVSAAVRV